jgi:hypothetical protein
MLYLSGISKPDLQYLAPINRHSSKHEDFKDHSQKTAIKVTNPAFTMPDSCLALRILFTAFLLLFSLMPTQATTFSPENPPRNPSLLGGISTNTLPPAKCFDNSASVSQTPLHRLLRPTDCLSLISNLYIADGVLKTRGSNGGPTPNRDTVWEATSGTCQASVELHEQMQNKISRQVWLKILRAFQILYTDCVKTREFGGQISIHDPGSLEPSKKYVVKLLKRPMAHEHAAQERDLSITDSSFAHANDSQHPKVVRVDNPEHIPLTVKFAALKRVCSERLSGEYINQRTKEVCDSFCSFARKVCDGAATRRYSNTSRQVAETALDFDRPMQAGKVIATGLRIKGKDESAHSAANEVSSVAIERRDLDLLSSVGLEVDGPHCYETSSFIRATPAVVARCREDIKKLRFLSAGPVESALWQRVILNDKPLGNSKVVKIETDLCTLSFKRYKMGSLHTLEDVIWKSAQRLLQKLSDKCLSSSSSRGVIFLGNKSTKEFVSINMWARYTRKTGSSEPDLTEPLIASPQNQESPRMHQINDSPGHTTSERRLAALRRLCSKDLLGGRISESTEKRWHSYCDWAMAGTCAIAGVAVYCTHHTHAAQILTVGATIWQGGKGTASRMAVPKKEESLHTNDEIHGDNLVKRRRSIDSGRPNVWTKHSFPALLQEIRVPPRANLQMQISG